MKKPLEFGLSILSLCSGCGAGIKVEPFDGSQAAMRGVPYNLSMTAFKITVVRTVTGCTGKLSGEVSATAEVEKKIDPQRMYTLYSDGFWSTTDIKGTYAADGSTTGLNTDAAGQAGTAISDIVTTVATIAPLIAMAGAVAATDVCDPKVSTAVTEVMKDPNDAAHPGLKAKIAKETAQLATLTASLTTLTAQVTALGSAITKKNQRDFWSAIQKVMTTKSDLDADQSELDKDTKLISDTQVIEWPTQSTETERGADKPYAIDPAVLSKWGHVRTDADNTQKFDVYLKLEKKSDGTPGLPVVGSQVFDVKKGVPVRFPVAGTLHVCALAPCDTARSKEVAHLDASVLQFGRVYTIPVEGGAFKSVTTAIAYDANGNPTTVEVSNKAATITAVTGAAKSSAQAIAAAPAAISAAELARTKAKTDQANAEDALATAEATNPGDAANLATLQSKAAVLNAQAAIFTAQQALNNAQKAVTS